MNNQPEIQDWGAPGLPQPQSSFDFVGMLQRRFWIIVLCIIFATGGGVFWFWKSPVKYSSVARTHIYFQNPNVAIMGNDGFATQSSIQSHDELIRSESVMKTVASEILKEIQRQKAIESDNEQTKNGGDTPEVPPGTEEIVESNIDLSKTYGEFQDLNTSQISVRLQQGLEVKKDRTDPNIYQLIYTGKNQTDCQIILRKIINSYKKHLDAKYQDEGEKIVKRIGEAQSQIDTELKPLRESLDAWREKNERALTYHQPGILVQEDGKKTNGYRIEAQRIYQEIADLKKKKQKIEDDQRWIDNALASKMSRPEILTHIDKFNDWLQLKQQIEKATPDKVEQKTLAPFEEPEPPANLIETRFEVESKKREIESMTDKGFGEKHPEVRKVKLALDSLETKLAFMEKLYKSQLEKAKKKYDELKKLTETPVEVKESDLPKLLEEYDLIGLHKAYLQQQLVRVNSDLLNLEGEHQEKLDAAKTVDGLLADEQKFLNAIQAKVSLNEAVKQKISEFNVEKGNGFYIVEDINSPTYGRQTEPSMLKIFAITTFLGLVVGTGLGYLVEIADKTFRNPNEIAQQLGMQVIGHVPVLSTRKVNAKGSAMDESLIAFHLPKSQQSEAFRAIRTSIFFNSQGKNSQIIQVTSPTPGDGKSTLAANLAVSLAQSGKRVLIVDADLRRPTVHYLFGTDSEIGFAAVLNGDAEIEDAISDSEVEGLSIMPAGSRPSNPSELLTSSHLYDLFEVLREKFDFIIMDTPPMLAVTDPTAVAARADGVILALRIKKNVKLSASRAKEVLDSVGAKIMGIVVNGAGMVQGNYSTTAAYGNGYGSGYAGNYYSYGYDYGESSYYYDEDSRATTAKR